MGRPTAPNWFDGKVACPACGHTCFDHAACVGVYPDNTVECLCSHRAHFTGEVG